MTYTCTGKETQRIIKQTKQHKRGTLNQQLIKNIRNRRKASNKIQIIMNVEIKRLNVIIEIKHVT